MSNIDTQETNIVEPEIVEDVPLHARLNIPALVEAIKNIEHTLRTGKLDLKDTHRQYSKEWPKGSCGYNGPTWGPRSASDLFSSEKIRASKLYSLRAHARSRLHMTKVKLYSSDFLDRAGYSVIDMKQKQDDGKLFGSRYKVHQWTLDDQEEYIKDVMEEFLI